MAGQHSNMDFTYDSLWMLLLGLRVAPKKWFEKPDEVEAYWRSLWETADKGKPDAPWLDEIRTTFQQLVPNIHTGAIHFTEDNTLNMIKRM